MLANVWQVFLSMIEYVLSPPSGDRLPITRIVPSDENSMWSANLPFVEKWPISSPVSTSQRWTGPFSSPCAIPPLGLHSTDLFNLVANILPSGEKPATILSSVEGNVNRG